MTVFEDDIKNCVRVLKDSGIILYPTDTVWGVGCNAMDETAIEKIYSLKKRPKFKSFIILLAEAKDIFQYVASPHPDIIDILESFPQPTTAIYNTPLGFPDTLLSQDGSLAIRVTKDPFCKALIKRFGQPIVSTSANLSGEPTPALFNMVSQDIIKGVDYTVQYRQDDMTISASSRIVRILDDGSLDILRS